MTKKATTPLTDFFKENNCTASEIEACFEYLTFLRCRPMLRQLGVIINKQYRMK